MNLRHFKHLPLLRLHLLPAPRAAGDEAEDAAWSGTGSGVHGTPVLGLNLTNSKSGITDSEGFFFWLVSASFTSVVIPPRDRRQVFGAVLVDVGVTVQLSISFGNGREPTTTKNRKL